MASSMSFRYTLSYSSIEAELGLLPSLLHVQRACLKFLNFSRSLQAHHQSPRSALFQASHPELRPLPSTGITRLHQYYEPVRHPNRPGLTLTGCRLLSAPRSSRLGFPVLRRSPLYMHAVATTPAEPGCCRSLPQRSSAFPESQAGRLPHCPFRGLLSVHYSLRPACSPSHLNDPLHQKASTASLPPPPLRLLPAGTTDAGWDSHPLRNRAFPRRTEICGLNLRDLLAVTSFKKITPCSALINFHLRSRRCCRCDAWP